MSIWKDWPEFKRTKVRNLLPALAAKTPDKELSHELIEEAVAQVDPVLAARTVEDDEFSDLIQEIYLEYSRNGAVD